MTPKERERPEILNTSRRDRIARGAGVERMEVDGLIKQFTAMRKVMDGMTRVGGKGPLSKIKALAGAKRQMADIGGMMQKMAEATAPPAPRKAVPRPTNANVTISKDDLRKKRKRERQNKRKNRR